MCVCVLDLQNCQTCSSEKNFFRGNLTKLNVYYIGYGELYIIVILMYEYCVCVC